MLAASMRWAEVTLMSGYFVPDDSRLVPALQVNRITPPPPGENDDQSTEITDATPPVVPTRALFAGIVKPHKQQSNASLMPR